MTTHAARSAGYLIGGAAATAVSLGPPLHDAAEELFAAHMIQHLLLVTVAAPLLAAGLRDLSLLVWLPRSARRATGRWLRRIRDQLPFAGVNATALVIVWMLHVIILWAWHVPRLYEAALRQPALHALEHGTLLSSAVAFWAVVRHRNSRAVGNVAALLYLFAGAAQSTALGALLTLSSRPSYPIHAATAERWGVTSLADQHAAGLIMWVAGGLGYLIAALLVLAQVLGRDESR